MAYSLVASFVFFHAIGMTFGTIGALGSGKKKETPYEGDAEGAGEIEIT